MKLLSLLFLTATGLLAQSSANVTPFNTNVQFRGYFDASSATASSPFVFSTTAVLGGSCPSAPLYAWVMNSSGVQLWCNPQTGLWSSATLPLTGSLGGDVSGTASNTLVTRLNGGAIPTNAALLGTTSLGKPTAEIIGYAVKSSSITAMGDSLTAGNEDNTGKSWPGYLQNDLNRQVENYGYYGQTSTQIAARWLNAPNLWGSFLVIWVGRNNLNQTAILNDIASMVAVLPTPARFLVLSVLNNENEPSGSTNYTTITAINAALAAAYPNNYVDIRSLLVTQYNSSIGPDVLDHNNSIPPYSLRAITNTGNLTAALNDTTTCPSGTANQQGDIVLVGGEYILWTSGSTCTRGYAGSTATTHSNGAAYTEADYEHLGYNGYQYVATQVAAFIAANDSLATSVSSFFYADALQNVHLGAAALNNDTAGLYNTALGHNSQINTTTGTENTTVGYKSMFSGQTIVGSNAFGYEALYSATVSGNDAYGFQALYSDTTGTLNLGLGYQALFNSNASYNTAIGYQTMYGNTTGNRNTGIGFGALNANSTGTGNNAFGFQALLNNTAGGNDAFGYQALWSNTSGIFDDAFGYQTLYNNTGSYNAGFGYQALYGNTTGQYNNGFGFGALNQNLTGSQNNGFGFQALLNTTTSGGDAFGYRALWTQTTGTGNDAFGNQTLGNLTTGVDNSGFGYQTLLGTTTGGYNSAFGYGALNQNATGNSNNAFGYQALLFNTVSGNDAFGYQAIYSNTTGISNQGFGYQALFNLTSGNDNSCVGYQSCYADTTGTGNAGFGYGTLNGVTSGTYNAAFGFQALLGNTTASFNVAAGYEALYSGTTGGYNTALGYEAGYGGTGGNGNTTGTYNTFLGAGSAPASSTQQTYMTLIGAGSSGSCSSCIVLGRSSDLVIVDSGETVDHTIFTTSTIPACNSGSAEIKATVSDATSPTYLGAYTGGGQIQSPVVCTDNHTGSFTWKTY